MWVLDKVYGMAEREIAGAIERVLQAETFLVQNEQEVFTAAMVLKAGRDRSRMP